MGGGGGGRAAHPNHVLAVRDFAEFGGFMLQVCGFGFGFCDVGRNCRFQWTSGDSCSTCAHIRHMLTKSQPCPRYLVLRPVRL